MLMEYRYKYAHINIRYIFIFYFPKIFCPDFSVKIFIHKSNVLFDLYRTLIISIRLSSYVICISDHRSLYLIPADFSLRSTTRANQPAH